MPGFSNIASNHFSLSFCSSSDAHTTSCSQHRHSHFTLTVTLTCLLVLCSFLWFSRKRETACSLCPLSIIYCLILGPPSLSPYFFLFFTLPPPPPINSPLASPQSLIHSTLDFDRHNFFYTLIYNLQSFLNTEKEKVQVQFCLWVYFEHNSLQRLSAFVCHNQLLATRCSEHFIGYWSI